MENLKKIAYKNLIGDTKDTINAIQRFIEKNSPRVNNSEIKENPADSINRVIKSIINEDIDNDIKKIIQDL